MATAAPAQIHPDIPLDRAWKIGRRIYIRCRYEGPLGVALRDLGANWDRDERCLWVGSGKLTAVLPLIQGHMAKLAEIDQIKTAGRWVVIPYAADSIRDRARELKAIYEGERKQWAARTDEDFAELVALVQAYHAEVAAARAAERTRRAEAAAAYRKEEAAERAQTAAEREAAIVAAAGRAVTGDRGQAHGQLHGRHRRAAAVDLAPKVGDVLELRGGRRGVVVAINVRFVSQDEIDDGLVDLSTGDDPGWHWWATLAGVHPTAEETAADEQAAARRADHAELAAVMTAAHRGPLTADLDREWIDGDSITHTVEWATHNGKITRTPTGEVWYQHPGWYDTWDATRARITDPELVARVEALLARGPRTVGRYQVQLTDQATTHDG